MSEGCLPAKLEAGGGGQWAAAEGTMGSPTRAVWWEAGTGAWSCLPAAVGSRSNVQALLLGQLLALLLACTAVCSTLLAQHGASFPTLQSSLNYLALALVYGGLLLRRRQPLHTHWRSYLVPAVLDVEANYCLVLAFRFTSLTSVTLLDAFSIPAAVVISTIVLRSRYKALHHAGAAVAVVGLAILVLGDRQGSSASSAPLLGDGLVLLGATLYAACNVAQERLLGAAPPDEVLAMVGLVGLVVSLAQGLPLELGAVRSAHWTPLVALSLSGFTAAMFLFYSLVPYQLMLGGAALLNLCLLSSDVWAAGARVLFFGGFSRLAGVCLLLSFLVVAAGLVLYTAGGSVAQGSAEQQHQQAPTYAPVQQQSFGIELEPEPESPAAGSKRDKDINLQDAAR